VFHVIVAFFLVGTLFENKVHRIRMKEGHH